MKVKQILVVLLAGFMFIAVGTICKVLQLPGANVLLTLGAILAVLFSVTGIRKVFTIRRYRELLNS
jgi:hypothetical protein